MKFTEWAHDGHMRHPVLLGLRPDKSHPWNSRHQNLEHPDWMAIDLDPEALSFDKVIDAAKVTHEILDGVGAANYRKASGKTGLHMDVPMGAEYDYDIVRDFGHLIAQTVNEELSAATRFRSG